jgi:hypothetical protein
LALTLILAAPALAEAPPYRLITDPAESARGTAMEMLQHLAAGDIEAAAALSNAPKRRHEVLRDYRNSVGEEEFKRVYARYMVPANRLIMEAAIGRRRLLVWDLGEAGNHLAAQYYIEVDGRFLMDDIPHEERSRLTRVLRHLRDTYAR